MILKASKLPPILPNDIDSEHICKFFHALGQFQYLANCAGTIAYRDEVEDWDERPGTTIGNPDFIYQRIFTIEAVEAAEMVEEDEKKKVLLLIQ